MRTDPGHGVLGAGGREEAEGCAAEGAAGGGLEPRGHAASACDVVARKKVNGYACFLLFVLVIFVLSLVPVRFECTWFVWTHAYEALLVIGGGKGPDGCPVV
jgi:hypothetical protein